MSLVESQRDAMKLLIDFLVDTKEYVDGGSNEAPHFAEYLSEIDVVELETYLLNSMASTPSYIESAVQEVLNLVYSLRRDFSMRAMSRADYLEDYSATLTNDIDHYRGLRELQSQYIQGRTPQQRT